MLDACEILDDFIPTGRLEGDVFCREYSFLDAGYWFLDTRYWILDARCWLGQISINTYNRSLFNYFILREMFLADW